MITKYAEGCYRLEGLEITKWDFDVLLDAAESAKLRRARICVHKSEDDPVQEMFVILMKDSPKGTYKYQRQSSKYLLRGNMSIKFGDGIPFLMDPLRPFIRVPANTFHTPTILSYYVLLHEIHQGPWTPEFMQRLTKEELAHMEAG